MHGEGGACPSLRTAYGRRVLYQPKKGPPTSWPTLVASGEYVVSVTEQG